MFTVKHLPKHLDPKLRCVMRQMITMKNLRDCGACNPKVGVKLLAGDVSKIKVPIMIEVSDVSKKVVRPMSYSPYPSCLRYEVLATKPAICFSQTLEPGSTLRRMIGFSETLGP